MERETVKSASLRNTWGSLWGLAPFLTLIFLYACGGGGGGATFPVSASTTTAPAEGSALSFEYLSDQYGMENPTYLSATGSVEGVTLRAAVASSIFDPDYRTVWRIDITDPAAVAAGVVYSLAAADRGLPGFPGDLGFFNGHQSTLLKTVGGAVTFDSYGTRPGDTISGSFSAVIEDGNAVASSRSVYTVSARFCFSNEGSGPILPAPDPVPAIAASIYAANCASCHSLGSFDPTAEGSAPDLALKGGELNLLFGAGGGGHKGVILSAPQLAPLKILLNVN